jgi:glycosyltransferase involved in cell wall biosynthesis
MMRSENAVAGKPVHVIVVPAYGQSTYLAECLASLAAQTVPVQIVVSTSTPYDGLDEVCSRFGARLSVHGPNRGIGPDWNAALACVSGGLVTLAHQDDRYCPTFAAEVASYANRYPGSALYFCDSEEVTESGKVRVRATNNRIKRLMVAAAFLGRKNISDSLSKRVLLGFGNPIVCPAVTLNLQARPGFRFREDLRTNMDWVAWLELADGASVTHIPEVLMHHRVHAESETARCLDDGARDVEDRMAFEMMWPRPVAAALMRLYRRSYQGYR